MAINSASLLSDTILFIRDRLKAGVTDPISTKRPSGQKFVLTAYPREVVSYPVITVKGKVTGDSSLGQQSEQRLVGISIEIRIWGRNEKEKNNLHDAVYDYLRTNQYPVDTTNTSTNLQLWDFSINYANDVDEPGEEGIKSKVSEYTYVFIAN